jgi:hypothetical protein
MLAAIEAIMCLFSKRTRDIDVIDKAIDQLRQSDDEIERRLRELRDRVEVYERARFPDGASDNG